MRGQPGDGGRGGGPDHRSQRRGGRRAARLGVFAGSAMAVAVAGPASAAPTPWTDPVSVTGTTLTATTVPTTTLQCGAVGLLSVTFTWTAVSGATSYTLFWKGGASSTTVNAPATSVTLLSAISSNTAYLVVNRAFGSVTWSSVASNTRSFTVAVLSFCG